MMGSLGSLEENARDQSLDTSVRDCLIPCHSFPRHVLLSMSKVSKPHFYGSVARWLSDPSRGSLERIQTQIAASDAADAYSGEGVKAWAHRVQV